jgi:hypothetical protein
MKQIFFIAALIFSAHNLAQTTIQLGGGGSWNSFDNPVCNLDNYSYTQQLYTAAEINAQLGACGGTELTAIQFNYRGAAGGSNFNNWTIFVGQVAQSEFSGSSDWVLTSNMTQVFNGTVNMPSTSDVWFEIVFTTPFQWNGTSNLVIAVDENSAGGNSAAGFRAYSMTNTALRSTGLNNIDPHAAVSTYPSKARFGSKPIIRMTFAGGGSPENPATGITGGTELQCVGGSSVQLSVEGNLPAWSAQWEWFAGSCESTVIGTGASLSVNPSTTTTYFVRPAGNSGCGTAPCIQTTVQVSNLGNPSVEITPSTANVCQGGTVSLTASSSQTVNYLWSTQDTDATIEVGPGSYDVTATNSDGCSASSSMVIGEFPNPTVSINPVAELCVGDNAVTLTANPAGGTFSGAHVAGTSFTPIAAGSFPVTYSYTDGNGCQGSANTTVVVTDCQNPGVSLNEIAKSAFSIYPNPSEGQFNLALSFLQDNSSLEIHALTGQLVHSQIVTKDTVKLDLIHLDAGVYLVQVRNGSTARTVKWVKR